MTRMDLKWSLCQIYLAILKLSMLSGSHPKVNHIVVYSYLPMPIGSLDWMIALMDFNFLFFASTLSGQYTQLL